MDMLRRLINCIIMLPLLIGGHKAMMLSDVCLTSVCLSRTSGLSREQTGLGRLKLAQM